MADHVSIEPEEPTNPGRETELQAQLDAAEDLKSEARDDRIKDTEREAKIEALEVSEDDLVEMAKDDPSSKKGTFAKSGYCTKDNTKVITANVEPSWFKKSGAAQRAALEKIMGTYRPLRSARKLKAKAVSDLPRPWTLKDHHESPDVRRRIAKADALLDAHPITKPPVAPAPAPEPVMGYCHFVACSKALPRVGIRPDTKFCPEKNGVVGKCRADHNRREANRRILDAAFRDKEAKVQEIPIFYHPTPAPEATPPMSAMHAVRSNQVKAYMMDRKKAA